MRLSATPLTPGMVEVSSYDRTLDTIITDSALRTDGNIAKAAADHYRDMPSLGQSHLLDIGELSACARLLQDSVHPSQWQALSWCEADMAQIYAGRGDHDKAEHLFHRAVGHAIKSEPPRRLKYHLNADDYLFRSKALQIYTQLFQQLGGVEWPDKPVDHQKDAYGLVQQTVVNPLLDRINEVFQDKHDPLRGERLRVLKGLLGEFVILQSFNRLQINLDSTDWVATPASPREKCRGIKPRTETVPRVAFDLKLLLADQTFIPLDIRWRESDRQQQPPNESPVGVIYANTNQCNDDGKKTGYATIEVAKAMRSEVAGKPPSEFKTRQLELLTNAVIKETKKVAPIGTSLVPENDRIFDSNQAIQSLSKLFVLP